MTRLLNRIQRKIFILWWTAYGIWQFKSNGIKIGKNATFYGKTIIELHPGSTIEIGNNCVFCSDSRFTALGVSHPVILRTLSKAAKIIIGNDCGMSGSTICAAISVEIGNGCLMGADTIIVDTDFHPINSAFRRYDTQLSTREVKPVFIEQNTFIGARSIVLKGVRIGKNSVIGAGSVVRKSIKSDSIATGAAAIEAAGLEIP